jgi:hypothetical protein
MTKINRCSNCGNWGELKKTNKGYYVICESIPHIADSCDTRTDVCLTKKEAIEDWNSEQYYYNYN